MRQTIRIPLIKKTTLLISVFTLSLFSTNAQFFKHHNTTLWLKSNPAESVTDDSLFIGNYKGLAPFDSLVKEQTDALANLHKGTVFLTLGTTDSITQEALFTFGRINVYREFMLIAGDTVAFEKDLGKAPGIVRVTYNFTQGNRHFPSDITKHENSFITELLYFDDLLNPNEIRLVESYLALKYSINITPNKDPKLRDYINGTNTKLWSEKTDHQFDEEVLALGRVDSLEWYQTQSYTADAASIQISLDTVSHLTEMPEAALENNSMLIMAKSSFSPEELLCGEGLTRRLWKLRFNDWQYDGTHFYITLNEAIQEDDQPMLSNGLNQVPLKGTVAEGRTTLSVPFFDDLYTNRYFLMWGATGIKCTPLCEVTTTTCTPEKTTGGIHLQIEQDALPAEVELYNLSNHQYLKQTAYEPSSTIQNLNNGTYQLVVKSEALTLADQVITLENCSNKLPLLTNASFYSDEEELSLQNGSQANQNTSNTEVSNIDSPYFLSTPETPLGISAFPNPVHTSTSVSFSFSGLNDQAFHIEIFDNAGAFQRSERFTPTDEKYVLEHDFKVPGVYTVRFLSNRFSDYVKIVINN